jgi:hypothetical protein
MTAGVQRTSQRRCILGRVWALDRANSPHLIERLRRYGAGPDFEVVPGRSAIASGGYSRGMTRLRNGRSVPCTSPVREFVHAQIIDLAASGGD